MSKFILRYTGKGPKPADDVKRLLAEGEARIIDKDDSPRMVLVEGPEPALRAAVDKLGDWKLIAETTSCALPEPHPGAGKIEKPPEG